VNGAPSEGAESGEGTSGVPASPDPPLPAAPSGLGDGELDEEQATASAGNKIHNKPALDSILIFILLSGHFRSLTIHGPPGSQAKLYMPA
jgi:hypothetical protein